MELAQEQIYEMAPCAATIGIEFSVLPPVQVFQVLDPA